MSEKSSKKLLMQLINAKTEDAVKEITFPAEPLPILHDNESLDSGSHIMLFNYYLPDPSIIGFGLWRDLNRILHYPACYMKQENSKVIAPLKFLLAIK